MPCRQWAGGFKGGVKQAMDPDLVDATELLFQSYATHSSGKKPVVDGGGMKRLASDCNLFEESTGLTSEFYAGIIRRCSAAQSDGEGSEQVGSFPSPGSSCCLLGPRPTPT